jgi:hypothetical protein
MKGDRSEPQNIAPSEPQNAEGKNHLIILIDFDYPFTVTPSQITSYMPARCSARTTASLSLTRGLAKNPFIPA